MNYLIERGSRTVTKRGMGSNKSQLRCSGDRKSFTSFFNLLELFINFIDAHRISLFDLAFRFGSP
jgi:hypothetical protein